MPLVMKAEGRYCKPVIICDQCGEEIAEAREGNYLWPGLLKEGEHSRDVVFIHKTCDHAFEAAHRVEGRWAWMELQLLPLFLARNLKVDLEHASEVAAMLASIR